MQNSKPIIFRTMNIELTTMCPLRCPQCYCHLEGGKHIDPDIAVQRIREGCDLGVREIMLSGGETLCYPDLYRLIRAGADCHAKVNVALSGVGFDQSVYDKLIEAGVSGIFVSLNGSTEEINALTRDGYEYAISALELLRQNAFPNTTINWVMHSNNVRDFPNLVALAEEYKAAEVTIIGLKPDANYTIATFPSREDMFFIRDYLRNQKRTVKISIETCFSPMLALASDTKLFGNLNVGKGIGCAAGRTTFNVNVDGDFSPCRHLEVFERHATLLEYWNESPFIQALQALETEAPCAPCSSCHMINNCRPCQAINLKIDGHIHRGNRHCPLD